MTATRRRHRISPPSAMDTGVVAITRRAAFGDVIGATVIADELARQGYNVQLNTLSQIVQSGVFQYHPSINTFGPHDAPCHVNLDGTYEHSELRKTRSAMSLFYGAAEAQLANHGIRLRPMCNLRPQLRVLPEEKEAMREYLRPFPRPWVIVVPKSNHWPNRTVPQDLWKNVAPLVNGTMLWSGTDRINDGNIVDLRLDNMRKLMTIMAVADLVVGVDTGPMWCAVGVNTPILGISQARPFDILLNDQVDWLDIEPPGISCIGCSEHQCPINEAEPPCQRIDPTALALAVNNRLETSSGSKISAIIPCLNDREPRILRCLDAVVNQVDEVVFSFDGPARGRMIPTHPKVRFVFSPAGEKTGFGKTCNRGARAATGRYLMFLNDDLYLDPGAVRQMKLAMQQEKAAIVGGLWRYPDGTIQHGGGHRGHGDVGFGHLDWKKADSTLHTITEMEFVTAACMLVRREAFYQAGAFGEEFGNYSEDADLCMKVRQNGWRVLFAPKATAIHDESQTTKPEKQAMLKAAHVVFREKWGRYFAHNPPGRLGKFV
jgi:GT2 family glycosyltransferase